MYITRAYSNQIPMHNIYIYLYAVYRVEYIIYIMSEILRLSYIILFKCHAIILSNIPLEYSYIYLLPLRTVDRIVILSTTSESLFARMRV